MLKCAACGKGGGGLKTCTACKLVKYCNATCQKNYRPKHKKECKKRAAEIFDEALFTEPSRGECPICCLPLPLGNREITYQACCGKELCLGCIHAISGDSRLRKVCPFCRAPAITLNKDALEMVKKRAEGGDPVAMFNLGNIYRNGSHGLPQNYDKANELWLQAGGLGCATANFNFGTAYYRGEGVERNIAKAKQYAELAAIGGNAEARHGLGYVEYTAGNIDRAMKHYMIAAGVGYDDSLTNIRLAFTRGQVTKEYFEKALRAHKDAKDAMKSEQREVAVAFYAQRRAAELADEAV